MQQREKYGEPQKAEQKKILYIYTSQTTYFFVCMLELDTARHHKGDRLLCRITFEFFSVHMMVLIV